MSDIILEILDARFINETRNSEIEEDIKRKNKKIIFVLNKSDLIDVKKIRKDLVLKEIYPYVFVSCKSRKGSRELRDKIKIEAKKIPDEFKVDKELGKITVGIVGYPNTGKSSIINLLIGKNSAPTAMQAGFTKGLQKVKLSPEIVLIDSPGIISQQDYSHTQVEKISKQATVGARTYSHVKNPELVIASIMKDFPKILENYYGVKADGDSETLIEELGKKMKFFISGGRVDEDRVAKLILKYWQTGKIKI